MRWGNQMTSLWVVWLQLLVWTPSHTHHRTPWERKPVQVSSTNALNGPNACFQRSRWPLEYFFFMHGSWKLQPNIIEENRWETWTCTALDCEYPNFCQKRVFSHKVKQWLYRIRQARPMSAKEQLHFSRRSSGWRYCATWRHTMALAGLSAASKWTLHSGCSKSSCLLAGCSSVFYFPT